MLQQFTKSQIILCSELNVLLKTLKWGGGGWKLDFVIAVFQSEDVFYWMQLNWGPGQCFAPQMGSSVCEHQCGSWQGLKRGMGRLQWHMLQFKLSLDPCSSGGPAGAQGGIHYNQTQAGFDQTPAVNASNRNHLLFSFHLLMQKCATVPRTFHLNTFSGNFQSLNCNKCQGLTGNKMLNDINTVNGEKASR